MQTSLSSPKGNVCYLITILETGEQYVGETSRIFRIRANEHYNHNTLHTEQYSSSIGF